MQEHGYIALFRRTFNHPLFRNEKPVSRFHAWAWLIAAAAWCPCQRRVGIHGRGPIATLDRGQLATTTRDLGKIWGWPHGRTRRFLIALAREGMIRTLSIGTATGTATGTASRGQYTIITICNYSQFQDKSTGTESQPAQQPARKPARGQQQAFEFAPEVIPQPSNQETKKEKEGVERGKREKRGRVKPAHGQVSKRHGTVWFDLGTDEYKASAEDFKEVTGAWPIPQVYVDGRGRWFKLLGEGAVPLSRATGVAQAGLEQFHRERRRKPA